METSTTVTDNLERKKPRIQISRQKRKIWFISSLIIFISILGLFLSWLNPFIGSPLKPGLDFTGGTQITLERLCESNKCSPINSIEVSNFLSGIQLKAERDRPTPLLLSSKVQFIDNFKRLVIRTPFLNTQQSKDVINEIRKKFGQFEDDLTSIDTIGPSLGIQLLKSSIISLLVAFVGIAIYIALRYDRRYAFLALVALFHDVVIACGVFAWLGIYIGLEVDSLFAVALLTISGYSVNDTVVVFDRIREKSIKESNQPFSEIVDKAVSATLTRTLYTSGTTLLPLFALILFGGPSLFWFATALSIGVIVGSWSSICLAPSLLILISEN